MPPMTPPVEHQEVISFWFEDINPKSWWAAAPDFDELVRGRFGQLLQLVSAGECCAWRSKPEGRLAEIIVLDQFSRNIHRGTAKAFSQDAMALALAQEAVAQGAHTVLSQTERSFLLLPYMHSESGVVHQMAEALYRNHAPEENYKFELRHKAIIDRFDRYPHRNEALGRTSTAAEVEFLKQPGSSF